MSEQPITGSRLNASDLYIGSNFSSEVVKSVQQKCKQANSEVNAARELSRLLRNLNKDPVIVGLSQMLAVLERQTASRLCKRIAYNVALSPRGLICIDEKISSPSILRWRAVNQKNVIMPVNTSSSEALAVIKDAIEQSAKSPGLPKVLQQRGGNASWLPTTRFFHDVDREVRDLSRDRAVMILLFPVTVLMMPFCLGACAAGAIGRMANPDTEEVYSNERRYTPPESCCYSDAES